MKKARMDSLGPLFPVFVFSVLASLLDFSFASKSRVK